MHTSTNTLIFMRYGQCSVQQQFGHFKIYTYKQPYNNDLAIFAAAHYKLYLFLKLHVYGCTVVRVRGAVCMIPIQQCTTHVLRIPALSWPWVRAVVILLGSFYFIREFFCGVSIFFSSTRTDKNSGFLFEFHITIGRSMEQCTRYSSQSCLPINRGTSTSIPHQQFVAPTLLIAQHVDVHCSYFDAMTVHRINGKNVIISKHIIKLLSRIV